MNQKETVQIIMILNEIHLDLVRIQSCQNQQMPIIAIDNSIERLQEIKDTLLSKLFQ